MASDPSGIEQEGSVRSAPEDGEKLAVPTFAAGRQRRILDLLSRAQELQVAGLAEEFEVSQETIRRDLRALERSGKLHRVHGGAVAFRETEVQPYSERSALLKAEKEAITELAMELDLVVEGQTIFIGGGSTTLPLARRLADHTPARYVTNTMEIAVTLARSGRHDVTLAGGKVHPGHELLSGQQTLEVVRHHVFDLAIVGTNAIDLSLGFLDYMESESILHQIVARQSRRYVVLADHSKFDRSANYCAHPLSAADLLISDRAPPEKFQAAFEEFGVKTLWPRRD